MGMTYKDSGVDIAAGEAMVKQIKDDVASTFNSNVLSQIGLFGGFFEVPKGYKNPVMVSSVDGVGTKLKIAFLTDKHDTIGQDLVNHCINDIAVCGATPLFFLDYMASGKLEPHVGAEIIKGMAKACRENNVSLIGGETAEMPGFYQPKEYDMSGTIVGIVEKDQIIKGDHIEKGDILVGLSSTGLHTNGYSLARKVLLDKYKVDTHIDDLGENLGDALLKVHKSYLPAINAVKNAVNVKGMSHITGGGIEGNTKRILQANQSLKIDWQAWDRPALFSLIQKEGSVPEEDMRKAFNLGIGIIFIVSQDDLNKTLNTLKEIGEKPLVIGEIA